MKPLNQLDPKLSARLERQHEIGVTLGSKIGQLMLGDRAKNRSIASNDAGSLPTAKTNAILKKQAAAKLYLEQKAVYNLIKR